MKKIFCATVLVLLLTTITFLAFNIQPAKASGTIYVRADGSVEGTAYIVSSDNVTYVFTANVSDSIVIERSNIVIDGEGYTLQGSGSGNGFDLGVNNVTIKNTDIKNFYTAIFVHSSSLDIISENKIVNNGYGIGLSYSSNNNISGNNIADNNYYGIFLGTSSNNNISRNNISNSSYGILLYPSSTYNSIIENNMTSNNNNGIRLDSSSNYNDVIKNNITSNSGAGIYLGVSSNNNITGNIITDNGYGGIWLGYSFNNRIHHNDFNNTLQVYDYFWDTSPSINIWDDGYPSGGNYWSNYNGTDSNGDGIGDTPYVIYPNNTDNYPLMSPYEYWNNPILGDVNRDMKVNMRDIGFCCSAFGSKLGDLNWNPNCDLNEDGTVNMRDIGIACSNFGKTAP